MQMELLEDLVRGKRATTAAPFAPVHSPARDRDQSLRPRHVAAARLPVVEPSARMAAGTALALTSVIVPASHERFSRAPEFPCSRFLITTHATALASAEGDVELESGSLPALVTAYAGRIRGSRRPLVSGDLVCECRGRLLRTHLPRHRAGFESCLVVPALRRRRHPRSGGAVTSSRPSWCAHAAGSTGPRTRREHGNCSSGRSRRA
jgi:hypothetical protein